MSAALTDEEAALCDARANIVDYDRINALHYLGHYTRRLPVSLTRMMENALDWEHLPHIHASSFGDIALIDGGSWGWRAKIGLPAGGHQLIDLIVDMPRHYWVSTVISGMGQGTEIHTQASPVKDECVDDHSIDIDVRFYLPEAPADPAIGALALQYLQGQYAQLYDEDLGLMSGRQNALNDRQRWRQVGPEAFTPSIRVGRLADLDPEQIHSVEAENHRYAVRRWQGEWIAHSAICPHLLGPLGGAAIAPDGTITCPWHGYRFDVRSGESQQPDCRALAPAPTLREHQGELFLVVSRS